MLKFFVPAFLGLALISPSVSLGQDCGCSDGGYDMGCVKTRKKIALVDSCVDVKRLRRVCETDECGCSRNRLALVSEPVNFKRLALVDVPVDPCRPRIGDRLREKVSGLFNRGCDTCDSGCDSCDGGIAAGDCGCDGGHSAMDYSSPGYSNGASIETMQREIAPRATQPRTIMQPRQSAPRQSAPRQPIQPNSSPAGEFQAPLTVEGYSG